MDQRAGLGDLFKRLANVDEISMRAGLIRERLVDSSREGALGLIEVAHREASLGHAVAQQVFLALGWALFDPLITERRGELGVEARARDLHHLADFLIPSADGESAGDPKRRVPDFGRGRPLTLGERKSLARTGDRRLIDRVVRDPHPDVVRILLDNPALREEDVVRICAMRPNDRDVLQATYQHRRWVVRYRPRHAIVRNPSCPLDVALLLAPLLRPNELREAAIASGLAPPLRLICRSILEQRLAQTQPPTE